MDPLIVLFGLGVGFLVGTTGMGGGSLMTPLLIIVFGVQPVVAVGTDLAYAAVTKTVGGIKHLRQGTVKLDIVAWLALGSIPGAVTGVYILDQLRAAYGDGFDELVLVLIASALLLTGSLVLIRALFSKNVAEQERDDFKLDLTHRATAVAVGLFVGVVLGITSAGSGVLIAIALILFFKLTPIKVVGTDVFHAALVLWAASLAHLVSGNIDIGLAGNILIGSIPGVWIGSHLAPRLPEAGLRPALAIVLLTSGLSLLAKAGIAIPVAALVAVPILLSAAAWLVHNHTKVDQSANG